MDPRPFIINLWPVEDRDFPPGPIGYNPKDAEAVRQMLRDRGFEWFEVCEFQGKTGVSLFTPFMSEPVGFDDIPEFLSKVTVENGVILYAGKTPEQVRKDERTMIELEHPEVFRWLKASQSCGDEDRNDFMRMIRRHDGD